MSNSNNNSSKASVDPRKQWQQLFPDHHNSRPIVQQVTPNWKAFIAQRKGASKS